MPGRLAEGTCKYFIGTSTTVTAFGLGGINQLPCLELAGLSLIFGDPISLRDLKSEFWFEGTRQSHNLLALKAGYEQFHQTSTFPLSRRFCFRASAGRRGHGINTCRHAEPNPDLLESLSRLKHPKTAIRRGLWSTHDFEHYLLSH